MDEKWSIEKLDGSNWITWKFQSRHLLMAKGLWKFVDGSAVLAEDPTREEREKFQAEQQKAFSTIVMSVSPSLLYLITSCELPRISSRGISNEIPWQISCSLKNSTFKCVKELKLMCT